MIGESFPRLPSSLLFDASFVSAWGQLGHCRALRHGAAAAPRVCVPASPWAVCCPRHRINQEEDPGKICMGRTGQLVKCLNAQKQNVHLSSGNWGFCGKPQNGLLARDPDAWGSRDMQSAILLSAARPWRNTPVGIQPQPTNPFPVQTPVT
ncbi:hypothetical protein CORC01_09154 [Colletotrichum orchidophilum]|uniref:Uncharacterized protein n=1 Tax=Colletotrichum orchidophilum TaxID=1209926 RepID=A0A1G4B2E3_9PEZI|nr:uncharacterized protein CORC01_09154 [Colletotrichum orchidophilum]OHE95564.1 hypothetical protein CORC01_09154 [Colletotrichum orchidophilum]